MNDDTVTPAFLFLQTLFTIVAMCVFGAIFELRAQDRHEVLVRRLDLGPGHNDVALKHLKNGVYTVGVVEGKISFTTPTKETSDAK